jgi:anti-anti-sigma regulatory factor
MRKTAPHGCAVTVPAPAGSLRADVRIIGDVDVAAAPLLAEAVRRLSESAPRSVFIDVAGVTSAGSMLFDFFRQVHNRTPRGSSVVVCRPDPVTRMDLAATGIAEIVVVCDGLLG